ncbi:MAG: phage holin family protein [Halanaerobium sp.]|nr:phage holin family protein [Halanaerobium sp.]
MRRKFFIRWITNGLALAVVAWLLPGIDYTGLLSLVLAALVLGLVNSFLRPLLVIISFPISLLTLGIFLFVINALMLLLTAKIVGGFMVAGFWAAFAGSILLSFVSWLISGFFPKRT